MSSLRSYSAPEPKDINNLYYQMKTHNLDSYIIKAVIERNEIIDRPEHDWQLNENSALVKKKKTNI